MRPRVDSPIGEDELREKVHDYAEERGVRMSRAWAELLLDGLNCHAQSHEEILDSHVPEWQDLAAKKSEGGR